MENISGNLGMTPTGMETAGFQLSPVNLDMPGALSGSLAPEIDGHVSEQMPTNIQANILKPISGDLGSQGYLVSNKCTENHNNDPMWQSFLIPSYTSGLTETMLNNLGNQQSSIKRKFLSESMTDDSTTVKLQSPNKKMVNMERRPWLQQLPVSADDPLQSQLASVSPRMQYLSNAGRKMMQMESVSCRSGKQSSTKKPAIPGQGPSKSFSDSTESVRSKMRDSLAAALALVQNKDESQKIVNSYKKSSANSPEKISNDLHPVEPASDAHASEGTPTGAVSTVTNVSVQDVQSAMQDSSNSVETNEKKQENQSGNVFTQDDVPLGDNIFVKDDLLQGNGLAWVLEPITELGEKVENEIAGMSKSDNRKVVSNAQDPVLLAFKIELELYKLFGGVNKKYKEKGRSLLFNLKDRNNPELRERVMSGGIPPERLCSMTAEELASKELTQWRQAKAEEMAQMVVLPDTEVDIRRLVKKTHKGEFQVEVEPLDSGVMEVSSGVSSVIHPELNVKDTKSASPAEKILGSNNATGSGDSNMEKDQSSSTHIAIPPGEGSDPMQGVTVDDEMKDANFLPPIVSLDEFMESLNSEPPFENLPKEDGLEKRNVVKGKLEPTSTSGQGSPRESTKDRVKAAAKHFRNSSGLSKSVAESKSSPTTAKSESSATTINGELVWEGSLQLGVSSVASVAGFFKSGEKTSTRLWPASIEVKGRVRMEAFQKFVQELPMSRSRAVMVIHLVSKQGVSQSERESLSEVADSYVSDGRVGFAEPAAAVELYICPPHPKSLDILIKLVPKDQEDAFKSIDNGLIGVIVWRKGQSNSLSPNSRHKHSSKRPHSSFRRHNEKNKTMTDVNIASPRDNSLLHHVAQSGTNTTVDDNDDDDDDIPPGFGPAVVRDDDDLPEFSFSGGGLLPNRSSSQPRSVDQVRALIHKYGKPSEGSQSWKANDDDDDDDIPEWQPQQAVAHHASPAFRNFPAYVVSQGGAALRPNTGVRPTIPNVSQSGEWLGLRGGGLKYGPAPESRSRGL